MKVTRVLVCVCCCVAFLVGCNKIPDQGTPEEQYARMVKRRVRDVDKAATGRQPKEVQVRLSEMTEDLEMYEKRSGPEHVAVYKEIQDIQKDLLEGFKKSNSPPGMVAKVQKMKSLAEKLPGGPLDSGAGGAPPSAG